MQQINHKVFAHVAGESAGHAVTLALNPSPSAVRVSSCKDTCCWQLATFFFMLTGPASLPPAQQDAEQAEQQHDQPQQLPPAAHAAPETALQVRGMFSDHTSNRARRT